MYKLFFLSFLFSACNVTNDLKLNGTRWEYKVGNDCISYISFSPGKSYDEYSCERDYTYSGKYEVKNDTLYLIEIDLASELPGSSKNEIKGRSKYLIKSNRLIYLGWDKLNENKWEIGPLFKVDIIYRKVTP